MRASDIPAIIAKPWAHLAGAGYIHTIPVDSQIGVHDGAASLADGFVPLNATKVAAGGIPPSIKDMNGILYEISAWTVWTEGGGTVTWDAEFVGNAGGYPAGAMLRSAVNPALFFISTADNNVTNPEAAGAAGWVPAGAAAATQAEVNAGTRDDVFVTPLTLKGSSEPGVVFLPGGVIMQYGEVYAVDGFHQGTGQLAFPMPFPGAVDVCVVGIIKDNGDLTKGGDIFAQWRKGYTTLETLAYTIQDSSGTNPAADGISYTAFGR